MLYPLLMQMLMNIPRAKLVISENFTEVVDGRNRIAILNNIATIDVDRTSSYFQFNTAEYLWMLSEDRSLFWTVAKVDDPSKKLIRAIGRKRYKRDKSEGIIPTYETEFIEPKPERV